MRRKIRGQSAVGSSFMSCSVIEPQREPDGLQRPFDQENSRYSMLLRSLMSRGFPRLRNWNVEVDRRGYTLMASIQRYLNSEPTARVIYIRHSYQCTSVVNLYC